MRLRELIKSASQGWPVLLIALATEPANAQFREILPESPLVERTTDTIDIELTPTRQPFVPPRGRPVPTLPPPKANIRRGIPAVPTSPTPAATSPTPALTETIPSVAAPAIGSMQLPPQSTLTPVVVVELKPNQSTANESNTSSIASPSDLMPTPADMSAGQDRDESQPIATSIIAPTSSPSTQASAATRLPNDTVPSATQSTDQVETVASTENGEHGTAPTSSDDAADTPTSSAETVAPVLQNPYVMFQRDNSDDNRLFAPGPSAIVPIEPLAFNQVVPGRISDSELKELWGEPAKQLSDGESKHLIYKAPGFKQVDVTSVAGTVEAILIHLEQDVAVEELAKQLDLSDIRVVKVLDDSQQPLAVAYPERGVMLTCSEGSDAEQASHILLEPVSGDLFRLRAEDDFRQNYSECLSDLEQAVRLNPEDAKAYWMQAEVLSWAGRAVDAMDNAKIATRIRPDVELYQLTKARLSAANGHTEDALSVTRRIANDPNVSNVVRARANYQLGNLTANGAEPEFEEALSFHMKAIDLAAKHVSDTNDEVRHMAKDVLVDCHLAIAQDIALGNFKRQSQVVPKWLMRATELAESFISDDQGEEVMRMEIYRTTLAIYTVMEGNFDATIATEEAIKEGRRLVGQSNDPLYQNCVERELAESLYYAAKIEHRCGRSDVALRYADRATVLVDEVAKRGQPTMFDRMMRGQLYFLTGSLHALQNNDHNEAVRNYEKAIPAFDDERIISIVDSSSFGDLFVSMGVSYWQIGQREKAIELTRGGAELMQQGVQAGSIELIEMTVPYGNLSAMHRENGNQEQAKHFASLMAKVQRDSKQR